MLKYSIGAVDYLQGKYPEAESLLKQSLEAQPEQVAASYYLGLTYDALGQDDGAVVVVDRRDALQRAGVVAVEAGLGADARRRQHGVGDVELRRWAVAVQRQLLVGGDARLDRATVAPVRERGSGGATGGGALPARRVRAVTT